MTKLYIQPSEIKAFTEDEYIKHYNVLNYFLKKEDEAYKKARKK
jgi:hypothetical protein